MTRKSSIAGVILAAGMSKRMGSAKQLLKLNGRYLLQWVVEAAVESDLRKIYLVLGHQHERILYKIHELVKIPKIEILYNSNFEQGMSTSVKCGLCAAQSNYDGVMFLLGDQPFISPKMINHLLNKYSQSDKQICVPVFRGRRGNPTIFGPSFFEQLQSTTGDMGGRRIILDQPEKVLYVAIDEAKTFFDIDSPEDLQDIDLIINFDGNDPDI